MSTLIVPRSAGQSIVVASTFVLTVSRVTGDGVSIVIAEQNGRETDAFNLGVGEGHEIGRGCSVRLAGINATVANLAFDGPREVTFHRKEVLDPLRSMEQALNA